MESENIIERLNKYEYENSNVYTGFKSVGEAKKFAEDRNGKLV